MDTLSAASKRSRAKSCTSCRQVKLRCDARAKYPAPCSRCSARKQECRMDANFKRVNTRSRLEPDSEMHNSAPSVDALGTSQARFASVRLSSPNIQDGVSFGASASTRVQQSKSSTEAGSSPKSQLAEEKWLELEPEVLPPWTLGPVDIEQDVILDLYKQFEEYYYVHLPILEPVRSLSRLYKQSPALFWAIAFTTSRHHPRHSHLYTKLREPFKLLISTLLCSPVPALKDLQALLVVCQWPFEVGYQSEDPSWMHCGFAVNAALHMGLDKFEDEVLFGHRRAKHSLLFYDPKYRRRTWMKAFEISTQLSTWHGLRPHISSAFSLQRLSEFYEGEPAREIIALTEIQRQVARNTTTLDDSSIKGPQVSLVHFYTQELDAIRKRFADIWSAATEINLQGAKLYLFTHYLLLADDQDLGAWEASDTNHFVATILQQGLHAALELIKVVKELGLASTADPPCSRSENGGASLLAHPKQHFRLAFYSCLFLFRYLDGGAGTSNADQDAARNAVSTVYQIFNQFVSRNELVRAARTIEVLGRSVVPGQKRIKTMVKTRMGASLNYNAIWTAAKLQGRQHDPEFTVTVSASGEPMVPDPGANLLDASSSIAVENILPDTSMPLPTTFEQIFPWGIWDDAAYDELGWGMEGPFSSGFPGATSYF